jgi:glycosyltransferase involved in cell wall biosynthesis
MTSWAILTGEYPPDPGGVSDYTAHVARALAGAGEEVHVFAPGLEDLGESGGVVCHRLPRGFGIGALGGLARDIARLPTPRRVLVQYVPHALGYRSMNLPLCAWLRTLGDPVDVMFHEVAYPWEVSHRALLAAAHRAMAMAAVRAADRVFASTHAWDALLRAAGARGVEVLAIPSSLPESVSPGAATSARARLSLPPGTLLVGHFGTFGAAVAAMLAGILERVLGPSGRVGLLVGRGSIEFAGSLAHAGGWRERLRATGALASDAAAAALAACDLLVQPFPDGITTRRTSAMAGLALGVPMVTNAGALTEPLWLDQPGLAIVHPSRIAGAAEALLSDPDARARAAAAGRALYHGQFTIDRTVDALLDRRRLTAPAPSGGAP